MPENIPDYPVIIKATHNSGGNQIVMDKALANWAEIRAKCKDWLTENYYLFSKEWQYKNIKPRLIVEKLLLSENGQIPTDFKFHCFHGKVEMISLDIDRGTHKHARNWYLRDWRKAPFKWSSFYNNRYTDPVDVIIPKPEKMDQMIEIAERLARCFLYIRVDLYYVKSQIYFGELTFHHDGGFQPIIPIEWDKKLGDKLKLPIGK